MTRVVITGASGFVGQNLRVALERRGDVEVVPYRRDDDAAAHRAALAGADIVFHLAGVNRPDTEAEFAQGNADFTRRLCDELREAGGRAPVVIASSVRAAGDDPYGRSKRAAEDLVAAYAAETGAGASIYRLPNLFGKWCRPNYNSVVATFCHNVARDLPISISDPARELELAYIDDVVTAFQGDIAAPPRDGAVQRPMVEPVHRISLGELAALVRSFRQARQDLHAPDASVPLEKRLYATYLSYLEPDDLGYRLDKRNDPRGSLAEFIKSPSFGQIFVSRTVPGITRGNHFHDLKVEKFLVLEGEAVIRFRDVRGDAVLEYPVRGEEMRVVDIPPGYTHSIENVGVGELVTLFWASEPFDPDRPDTYMTPVLAPT